MGVDGHCIPVDPYMLIEEAAKSDFWHQFLKLARYLNDRMPRYIGIKTVKALLNARLLPQESLVLLLGKAFKPEVADVRNTPHGPMARWLADEYTVTVDTYDPYVLGESPVGSAYEPVDAGVLVTAHAAFEDFDFERLAEAGVSVFVDGRNAFGESAVTAAGLAYVGVGR